MNREKLKELIKRFEHNAEYERTHGNLQGCLEFKALADELKKLEKLENLKEQEQGEKMKINKVYNYYFVANVRIKNAGVQQFAFDCTCAHEIPTWDDIQNIKQELIKKKNLTVENIEDDIIMNYHHR